jgi:hypothetical protein
MTAMSGSAETSHPQDADSDIVITVLPYQAVDEMIHKVLQASARAEAAAEVAAWREQYGCERWMDIGHHHCVVGSDLMYLHDCPDGMLVPHVRRPDGREEMFTDAAHANALF